MFQFGIGGMYGRPVGGNQGTPSGPQIFGTVQDVSVDFTQKLVPLRGQLKGPDDIAPGDMDIKGKGGFGRVEVEIYNSLLFGATISAGVKKVVPYPGEPQTVPSSGANTVLTFTEVTVDALYNTAEYAYSGHTGAAPVVGDLCVVTTFLTGGNNVSGRLLDVSAGVVVMALTTQVNETDAGVGTITHAGAVNVNNAATFLNDLGVKDALTGQQLQQVAAGFEATGKYSVVETGSGKGVYTFAGADAGRELLFFYAYTDTGDGETMLVTNQLQGYGPVFELYLMMPYQGANGLHLFNCRSSKMSAPLKRDNYLISDFEFESFPNAAGQWFEWFQIQPGN
jgi:hypothetical protein